MSKRKMQSVAFTTVEEFWAYLPAEEYRLATYLYDIVLDTLPSLQEKLSYNVPFFKGKRNICYIWPASILWGKKASYTGVRMGFTYGSKLTDPECLLSGEKRKQVYWLTFTTMEEIQSKESYIKALLIESALMDAEA